MVDYGYEWKQLVNAYLNGDSYEYAVAKDAYEDRQWKRRCAEDDKLRAHAESAGGSRPHWIPPQDRVVDFHVSLYYRYSSNYSNYSSSYDSTTHHSSSIALPTHSPRAADSYKVLGLPKYASRDDVIRRFRLV